MRISTDEIAIKILKTNPKTKIKDDLIQTTYLLVKFIFILTRFYNDNNCLMNDTYKNR